MRDGGTEKKWRGIEIGIELKNSRVEEEEGEVKEEVGIELKNKGR